MNDLDRERLGDILDAIERIQRYCPVQQTLFDADEVVQDAIVRRIMVIGEAASKLSKEFRESENDVPWAEIITMRHIVVHDYGQVDLGVVWSTVQNDIGSLHAHVSRLLSQASN